MVNFIFFPLAGKMVKIIFFPPAGNSGPYGQKNGGGIVVIPPPRFLRRAYAVSCRETKNPNPLPTANRFGFSYFGGLEGDRTLDLCDAKRHIKLFCMISNHLWWFPLGFSFFPSLFETLISMCYAAVCGGSCGQKRSPPFAGNGFPAWMGSVFRASDCLHCTSEGGIKQVISVPSRTQKMGGCKQKEIPRFQRLRKLKRIFMRFPHSP